jgi:hypothetical protein
MIVLMARRIAREPFVQADAKPLKWRRNRAFCSAMT